MNDATQHCRAARAIFPAITVTVLFGVALHSAASAQEFPAAKQNQDLPNIILMMADDMGMGDCSAFQDVTGNADPVQIHTPAMESLARRGVRFTDAHTPSTRCTNTRYGLLTGRYAWRGRMKHWVLFGSQGDPMIELDRPTIATFLQNAGYTTGMVGKWHVGLRYQNHDGKPAAGFLDADLTRPLFDCPLDHGFDVARFTSRSHGTSGAQPGTKKNGPNQNVGPGHIDGRTILSSTADGRRLANSGPQAYELHELGGRHSDNAIAFLDRQAKGPEHEHPFFLYYASNSNHSPYTPDSDIGGRPVQGHGRSIAGDSMGPRGDFVYENDAALDRLMDYLTKTPDPRNPGAMLDRNTIVIFTSDNGAEKRDKWATGPFRSHKGSTFEGGHRVPFIVSWPDGGVGNGNDKTPGMTNGSLIGLHDMFATFADVIDRQMPDWRNGQKGGEDSISVLASWRGGQLPDHVMFHNDHAEASPDRAVAVVRVDNPVVGESVVSGQWKLFFSPAMLRVGRPVPESLYDLASDPMEQHDLIGQSEHEPLIRVLTDIALEHRTVGGHRIATELGKVVSPDRVRFAFSHDAAAVNPADGNALRIVSPASSIDGKSINARFAFRGDESRSSISANPIEIRIVGKGKPDGKFSVNGRGLGISGNEFNQVDGGEAVTISFNCDVIVESIGVVAGNGECGGFYHVGDQSKQPVYCTDADNDTQDQHGVISDVGVLPAGETVFISSAAQFESEPAGQWRIGSITVRWLPPGFLQ